MTKKILLGKSSCKNLCKMLYAKFLTHVENYFIEKTTGS